MAPWNNGTLAKLTICRSTRRRTGNPTDAAAQMVAQGQSKAQDLHFSSSSARQTRPSACLPGCASACGTDWPRQCATVSPDRSSSTTWRPPGRSAAERTRCTGKKRMKPYSLPGCTEGAPRLRGALLFFCVIQLRLAQSAGRMSTCQAHVACRLSPTSNEYRCDAAEYRAERNEPNSICCGQTTAFVRRASPVCPLRP